VSAPPSIAYFFQESQLHQLRFCPTNPAGIASDFNGYTFITWESDTASVGVGEEDDEVSGVNGSELRYASALPQFLQKSEREYIAHCVPPVLNSTETAFKKCARRALFNIRRIFTTRGAPLPMDSKTTTTRSGGAAGVGLVV
jgi:hypothetical protein